MGPILIDTTGSWSPHLPPPKMLSPPGSIRKPETLRGPVRGVVPPMLPGLDHVGLLVSQSVRPPCRPPTCRHAVRLLAANLPATPSASPPEGNHPTLSHFCPDIPLRPTRTPTLTLRGAVQACGPGVDGRRSRTPSCTDNLKSALDTRCCVELCVITFRVALGMGQRFRESMGSASHFVPPLYDRSKVQ